jgi:hypothetical protein
MAEYGKASTENLAEIDTHIDVNTKPTINRSEADIEAPASLTAFNGGSPEPTPYSGENDTGVIQFTQDGRRFVVCPECGAVVWL